MAIDDYREHSQIEKLKVWGIVVKCDEFTTSTPLYNPDIQGVPLVNNDEPLYTDADVKLFPFPFIYQPPSINQEQITDGNLSISALNQLAYSAIKDVMSTIEFYIYQYRVESLDESELVTVYDAGEYVQERKRHRLVELQSSRMTTVSYSHTYEATTFTLQYFLNGRVGIGTLAYTVDLFPNLFEQVY